MGYTGYIVEVVHVNKVFGSERICRPSPLGNPWPIIPGQATRKQVCDKYVDWFAERVQTNDPVVMRELLRLHKVGKLQGYIQLGCFCRPLYQCHGDTIQRFLLRNQALLDELEQFP